MSALDVAKGLIDHGFHPPTIYFPLIVPEALMIEPTETESKETLDAFAEAMIAIAREAAEHPQALKEAPRKAPSGGWTRCAPRSGSWCAMRSRSIPSRAASPRRRASSRPRRGA